MKQFFFTLLLLLPLNIFANAFCDNNMDDLPIQQNGRVKPLLVHAGETLKILTGKKTWQGANPSSTYCELSLNSPNELTMPIEHVELKTAINLTHENKNITYKEALNFKDDLRRKMLLIKIDNSFKKSLQQFLTRVSVYEQVTMGDDWMIYVSSNWVPIKAVQPEDVMASKVLYIKDHGDKYLVELTMQRLGLPHWALAITIFAIVAYISVRSFYPGLILATITLLTQMSYIIFRIYVSGRAPITNMYETVLFSGFGALLLALIIGHYRNEKKFILVGLTYNAMTMMMINFAHGMLNPHIGPLVPVLRDNFWLSTHVTTIILSYSALALSWILANFALIQKKFKGISVTDEKYFIDLIYTTLKYGTVMLGAGVILGGVWADYSWGRFWGWDPKETWSLIVLFIYMAIIHGKYTTWIPNSRFIPMVAGAFMSVMMAWFGVNYILATGLHSYGFSEGGAIFLGSFFLIQIIILVLTANFSRKEA
jgi:ABC-type transport system involved in cytochrome c biogenesis permease subunit